MEDLSLRKFFDIKKGADEADLININRPSRNIQPARKLLIALLQDAMHELERNGVVNRFNKSDKQYVIDWICSKDEVYVFSFINVCEELGLDPQAVKKSLLKMRG